MSKSDPSKKACINLIDDPEMIRLKIMRAKTDSQGKVNFVIKNNGVYRLNMIRVDQNS